MIAMRTGRVMTALIEPAFTVGGAVSSLSESEGVPIEP